MTILVNSDHIKILSPGERLATGSQSSLLLTTFEIPSPGKIRMILILLMHQDASPTLQDSSLRISNLSPSPLGGKHWPAMVASREALEL